MNCDPTWISTSTRSGEKASVPMNIHLLQDIVRYPVIDILVVHERNRVTHYSPGTTYAHKNEQVLACHPKKEIIDRLLLQTVIPTGSIRKPVPTSRQAAALSAVGS